RAPHLLCSRALEVRRVRLRARRLASAAPCKRLQNNSLRKIDNFDPVNGYKSLNMGMTPFQEAEIIRI
ncbi:MAG: hypothetical protein PF482_00510, partial [Desulfobacteraceae bacterium]|nr:hypothetical protein [Desulfobacteraceae bacterium]